VPRVKFIEVEEERGREAETVSVEMDGLMGTADEAGLSVGPLRPEVTARPAQAKSHKDPSRLTEKEVIGTAKIVSAEHLQQEQIADSELSVIRG